MTEKVDINEYKKYFLTIEKAESNDLIEFDLKNEAHYETIRSDILRSEKEDLLNIDYPGNIDWYLNRLFELDFNMIKNLEISDLIKKQIMEIKELYNIEIRNGKHFIIARSDNYSISDVREWLQNCLNATEKCEEEFCLSKVLIKHNNFDFVQNRDWNISEENLSPSNETLKSLRTFLPEPDYKIFIGREEFLKYIDSKSKIIVSAVSGTGKTSLIRQYAERVKKRYTIRWILSDTRDKISESYNQMCKEIGCKQSKIDSIEFLNDYIETKKDNENFLFIFDNVEKFEDIKPFIEKFHENIKVIITTKNNLDIPTANIFEKIALGEFSDADAKKYLQSNMNGDLGEENLKRIVEITGKIPYRLKRFINLRHDDEYKLLNLNEFLQIYETKYSNSQLMFKEWVKSDKENEKLMWSILKLVSRLEPEFCNIEIIAKSLSIKNDKLIFLIKELERQNFITHEFKEIESGIKIIRMIQDEIIKHADQCNIDLFEYDEKLLRTLYELFRTRIDKRDFKKAQLLYSHVCKLLNNIDNGNTNIENNSALLFNLNFKLSEYHLDFTKNYEFAILRAKKAIDLCKKYHQKFSSFEVLIKSLRYTAYIHRRFENYLEELKYLERCATMEANVNGTISSNVLIGLRNVYGKLGDTGKHNYLFKLVNHMIKTRGVYHEKNFEIKKKIQPFLNEIQAQSSKGNWIYQGWNIPLLNWIMSDYGVGICSEDGYLKQILHDYKVNEANKEVLEIAKMLVFEAINIGILNSESKNYECSTRFHEKNIELVEKMAEQHPEYFVDESIVRNLFKNDAKKFEKIIRIDSDKMKNNKTNWFTF